MAVKFRGHSTAPHLSCYDPDVLDQVILWKAHSPALRDIHWAMKEQVMQRQFTIELRVDYADNGKNEAMRTAIAAAARHVFATAQLLSDGVKPQVAIYSDDFFVGREDIALLPDTIAQGQGMIDMDSVSDELLGAFKNVKPTESA